MPEIVAKEECSYAGQFLEPVLTKKIATSETREDKGASGVEAAEWRAGATQF